MIMRSTWIAAKSMASSSLGSSMTINGVSAATLAPIPTAIFSIFPSEVARMGSMGALTTAVLISRRRKLT